MTYSEHHRAEKQRGATARWRAKHEPRWVRCKEYQIGEDLVVMRELSRRGTGQYGMGEQESYRVNLIMLLGGSCANCGMDDLRCLQLDHVHAGGCHDRQVNCTRARSVARGWHGALTGKYQILCANCNWIKRYENNEHRMN